MIRIRTATFRTEFRSGKLFLRMNSIVNATQKTMFLSSHLCDVITYLAYLTNEDIHSMQNISVPELRHRKRRTLDEGRKVGEGSTKGIVAIAWWTSFRSPYLGWPANQCTFNCNGERRSEVLCLICRRLGDYLQAEFEFKKKANLSLDEFSKWLIFFSRYKIVFM
jgi:hypothetical protein